MNDVLDYYRTWVEYRRWYLRIPGAQLAVRRHGELLLSTAFGAADLRDGSPLTERHLFRIASHSKSLCSVLILQLVEGGAVRLDDAVGSLVPDLAATPVADRTVGELLAHGGGVIRDGEDGDFWQTLRPFPDEVELVAMARAASAATLARNEHWKYSNIGFGLLGLVIRALTGATFAERVRTHIAGRLGLTDLGGEYDPSRVSDYAAGHSGLASRRERAVIEHVDTRALAAATGCHATASDLTAFYSALLPGEDVLLSADSQRLQRRRQWNVRDDERGYGLGVFLDRIAERDLFGHTGGYPGHITATYADASDGWVVSALTNAIDGAATDLASGLFRLLRVAEDADHAPAADAARFIGRFAGLWGVLDVAVLDGRLFAVHPTDADPAAEPVPLEVVDDTTLKIIGGRGGNSYGELMRYEIELDGTIRSVRADSGAVLHPFVLPAD